MTLTKTLLAIGIVFIASISLSFVHPWGNVRSATSPGSAILVGSSVPGGVQPVLETKCADCHSTHTNWPIYSRVAPVSWLVERDVVEGRKHLSLSGWEQYTREDQIDLLTKIASESRSGEMPPRQYVLLHPEAHLSDADKELIYNWAKAERKRIRNLTATQ